MNSIQYETDHAGNIDFLRLNQINWIEKIFDGWIDIQEEIG